MNKKQSLEWMIEHWNCLAESKSITKTLHFAQAKEWNSNCALCEYNDKHGNKYCGRECLVDWNSGFGGCLGPDSSYSNWKWAKTEVERKKYAIEVATIAEDALDRMENKPKRRVKK